MTTAFLCDQVQHPPPGNFNSDSLTWYKDDTHAVILVSRIDDFLRGESGRPETNCRFYKRKTEDRAFKTGKKTIRYWCSFGPLDNRDKKSDTLPEDGPSHGKGSQPLAQKQLFGRSVWRGCQAHFQVIYYLARPEVCVIKWAQRQHHDTNGKVCHGALDPTARAVGAHIAHRLSKDCLEYVRRLVRTGLSPPKILRSFHKQLRSICRVPNRNDVVWARDLALKLKDIQNVQQAWRAEEQSYSADDATALHMWVDRHPEQVIYYQRGDPIKKIPFTLVWATDWMQEKLAELGHGNVVAWDATFGTNKYEYSLYTLLCYDGHQNGLPCCWALMQRHKAKDLTVVLEKVKERVNIVRAEDLKLPGEWKPTCFLVDDADEEQIAIRKVFPEVPINLCLWHVCRAWLTNLLKKCGDVLNRADMNRQLGDIMYTWSTDGVGMSERFIARWSTLEPKFVKYYIKHWAGRMQWWVKSYRTYKHSNQDTNGAVERWHRTMKAMLLLFCKEKRTRKLAWLVNLLSEDMEMWYWVLDELKDQGAIDNKTMQKIVKHSIKRAREIPNKDVQLCIIRGIKVAFVASASSPTKRHEIVGYNTTNVVCSCGHAIQGNTCKHQIKALVMEGYTETHLFHMLGTKMGTRVGGFENLNIDVQTEVELPAPEIIEFPFPQNVVHEFFADEEQHDQNVEARPITKADIMNEVSEMLDKTGNSQYFLDQAHGRLNNACQDMYNLKSRHDTSSQSNLDFLLPTYPFIVPPGTESSLRPRAGLVDHVFGKNKSRFAHQKELECGPPPAFIKNKESGKRVSAQAKLDDDVHTWRVKQGKKFNLNTVARESEDSENDSLGCPSSPEPSPTPKSRRRTNKKKKGRQNPLAAKRSTQLQKGQTHMSVQHNIGVPTRRALSQLPVNVDIPNTPVADRVVQSCPIPYASLGHSMFHNQSSEHGLLNVMLPVDNSTNPLLVVSIADSPTTRQSWW